VSATSTVLRVVEPSPPPSSYVARQTMRANRRVDTRPELLLRSEIHRRGLRFRKDLRVDAGGLWVRPDIVFTRLRLAVFVDGCFWHSCPVHAAAPKANSAFWAEKMARNRARDAQQTIALQEAGWLVLRVWEHQSATDAADIIEDVYRTRDAQPCAVPSRLASPPPNR